MRSTATQPSNSSAVVPLGQVSWTILQARSIGMDVNREITSKDAHDMFRWETEGTYSEQEKNICIHAIFLIINPRKQMWWNCFNYYFI